MPDWKTLYINETKALNKKIAELEATLQGHRELLRDEVALRESVAEELEYINTSSIMTWPEWTERINKITKRLKGEE